MLCGLALMDQAPVLDGQCFDLLPFCENCRAAASQDLHNLGHCCKIFPKSHVSALNQDAIVPNLR